MKRKPIARMDYTDWTLEQHIEYLRTHAAYQDYYAQYKDDSIEAFIDSYAKTKRNMFKNMDSYRNAYDKKQTQFLTDADNYIDWILQKKLFNLQCQWRAELIDLPLVEICEDFEYWEKHIRQCPFIEPVTQAEIDLCIRFLTEELDFHNNEVLEYDSIWQSYDEFKNYLIDKENKDRAADGDTLLEYPTNANKRRLPDIYTYFDKHQSTGNLLNLPDIRGQKDLLYAREGYRLQSEQWAAERKTEAKESEDKPYIYKPSLYAFSSLLAEFIEAVEDEAVKEAYKYYVHHERGATRHRLDDEMDYYFNFLLECDEDVPMEANSNWASAVIISVLRYKQKKTAEMLVYSYDTYWLEFDEDQPFDELVAQRAARHKFDEKEHRYQMLDIVKSRILDGRESLDGVRDFNY